MRRGAPVKKSPTWQARVRTLAESGMETPDILRRLRLELEEGTKARATFDDLVRRCHSGRAVATSLRLFREGVQHGKVSALVAVAEAWVPRGEESFDGDPIGRRVSELVKRRKVEREVSEETK